MIAISWGVLAMAQEPASVDVLTPDRRWMTVHDTVMGGVSDGEVTPIDGGVRFSGTVSLDNNGGFASARTLSAPLGLGGIERFELDIEGDGHVWQLTVRRDDLRIRAGSWRAMVPTQKGFRQTLTVEVADLEPVAFGRPVPNAPPLVGATEHIDSVGFLISSKQDGPYELKIYGIRGIRGQQAARH